MSFISTVFFSCSLLFSFFSMAAGSPKIAPIKSDVKLSEKSTMEMEFPLLFVADNQFHNLYGEPSFFRTALVDNLGQKAIRPPILDLFSPLLMEYTIRKFAGNSKFLIFNGDMTDISCKSELSTFINTMKLAAQKGWVMVPGNHDSTFYGSIGPSDTVPNDTTLLGNMWKNSCGRALVSNPPVKIRDVAILKDDLIKHYLSELLKEQRRFPDDFPITAEAVECNNNQTTNISASNGKDVEIKRCSWKSPREDSFLQRVFARWPAGADTRHSFRSFIVQEINLKVKDSYDFGYKGILLDTTDYERSPKFLIGGLVSLINKIFKTNINVYNSGIDGQVTEDQKKVVEGWLKQESGKNYYLFFGHHNWDKLDRDSKTRVKSLLLMKKNSIYVAGHTHQFALNQSGEVKEIILGSITDRPEVAILGVKNTNHSGKEPLLEYVIQRKLMTAPEIKPEYLCRASLNAQNNPNELFRYTGYRKVSFPDFIQDHIITMAIKGYLEMFVSLDIFPPAPGPEEDLYKKALVIVTNYNHCKDFFNVDFRHSCMKEKAKVLEKLEILDKDIMKNADRVYLSKRLAFGACQAIWSSKAEFP